MKEIELMVYCIYDKEKEEYWKLKNGKKYWNSLQAARNSWNTNKPARADAPEVYKPYEDTWFESLEFDEQTRYVVQRITAIDFHIEEVDKSDRRRHG